jgi:SulP family sulfate permease
MADTMTKTKHDRRKEMLGLGLANIASGLMGGIPATAALARTSTNAKNGATHQTSASVSSITVGVISLLLLPWFKFIPMPVIAAILVFVSVRMVEQEHYVRMWEHDKRSFIISLISAAITVIQDPITGVLFGTAVALLIFSEKISHGPHEMTAHTDGDTLIYTITGQLAYLNAESHVERFQKQPVEAKRVVLRLRQLQYVDLEGMDALEELIKTLEMQGKTVLISGMNPSIKTQLNESDVIRRLEQNHAVFIRTSEAIAS